MSENKTTLICRCTERNLVDPVDAAGAVVVRDLCRAAAEDDPVLGGPFTTIHACHARSVRALFEFSGHPLDESVEIKNHRRPVVPVPEVTGESHPAWYPVIDYGRCTSCGQCHDFCLFGVYEKTAEGKVVVSSPESCKNNCPACARICPETAIIFPKAGEAPINGAAIRDEAGQRAKVRVNVEEILGEDVYATLNARKQKRRSLLNRKKVEQALAERKHCSENEA